MIVVADASPLILLSAIGRLDVVRDLFDEVVVPRAVWNEVTADAERPGAGAVADAVWLVVYDDPAPIESLAHLGRGESMAIALAQQLDADLVLVDDLQGRKAARRHGVRVRGTLGVLVDAKGAGLIPLLRPVMDQLVERGMRISDDVVQRVLESVGE